MLISVRASHRSPSHGDAYRDCHRFLVGLVLLFVASCGCGPYSGLSAPQVGLLGGEDSWQHYAGGGLFHTNSGSMSPEGTTIAIASPSTGNGDIYLVERRGNSRRRLTSSNSFEGSPLFTPDGQQIVFTRETDGRRHLWTVKSDGTAEFQLTVGDVLDDPLQISGDGKKLLFMRGDINGGQGKRVRAHLLDLTTRGGVPECIGEFASFGPDSTVMAFNPVGKSGEVWLKNLTDATEVYLAQGAMPAFSPDGKHLLVARQRTPGKWERDREVWLLDVNSGSGRRVGIGHSPCFLPDGRGIVFFQGYTCRVFLTDMSDDKIVELESPRAFKTQPQVCLDGSGCLIRVASDGQLGEIYLLDGTQHTFAELTSLK